MAADDNYPLLTTSTMPGDKNQSVVRRISLNFFYCLQAKLLGTETPDLVGKIESVEHSLKRPKKIATDSWCAGNQRKGNHNAPDITGNDNDKRETCTGAIWEPWYLVDKTLLKPNSAR